jgi:hypothetical protein
MPCRRDQGIGSRWSIAVSRQEGQTLGEYGLILVSIVILAVVLLAFFGGQVVTLLTRTVQAF